MIKIDENLRINVSVNSNTSGIDRIQNSLKNLENQAKRTNNIDTSKLMSKLASSKINPISPAISRELINLSKSFEMAGSKGVSAGSGMMSFKSSTSSVSSSLMGLSGSAGVAVLAISAVASIAVEAGQAMFELAMKSANYHDQENAFYIQSGKNSSVFKTEAENLSTLGMSYISAAGEMSGFYRQLRAEGMNQDQASKMAIDLVKRAGDVASTTGVSKDRALFMMKDAMEGIYRPFKQVRIMMSDDEMKMTAYAHGIAKVGEQLTEAQKAYARYTMVMNTTSFTQGDLALTQDQTVNRLDQLGVAWDRLKLTIGMGIEPFVNSAIGALTGFLKTGIGVAEGIRNEFFKLYIFLRGVWGFLSGGFKVSAFNEGTKEAMTKINSLMNQNSDINKERSSQLEKETDANNQLKKNAEDQLKDQKAKNKAMKDNLQTFDQIHKLQKESEDGGSGGSGGAPSGLDNLNNGVANDVNVPTDNSSDKTIKPIVVPILFQLPKLPQLPMPPAVLAKIEWGKLLPFIPPIPSPVVISVLITQLAPKMQDVFNEILDIIKRNKKPVEETQKETNNGLEAENARAREETAQNTNKGYQDQLGRQLIFNNDTTNNNVNLNNGMLKNNSIYNNEWLLNNQTAFNQNLVGQSIFNNSYKDNTNVAYSGLLEGLKIQNKNMGIEYQNGYNTNLKDQKTFDSDYNFGASQMYSDLMSKAVNHSGETVIETEKGQQGALDKTAEYKPKFAETTAETMEAIKKKLVEGGELQVGQTNANVTGSLDEWKKSNYWITPVGGALDAINVMFKTFNDDWFKQLSSWAIDSMSVIVSFNGNMAGNFVSMFEGISSNVAKWANSFGNSITNAFRNVVNGIKAIANSVGASIDATIPSWEEVQSTFSALKQEFNNTVDVKSFMTAGALTSLSAIGKGIYDTAVAGLGIVEGATAVIIPPIYMPPKQPTQEEREMTQYANGGIITREQVARIGEYNRPEAIVPLENSNFIAKFANMVAMAGGGSSGNIRIEVPVLLDGRQIYKTVVDYDKKAGKPLINIV